MGPAQRQSWIIVKAFSVNLDNNLVVSFEQAHATALKAFETLTASIDQNHTENIEGLRRDLMSLRGNFNELMQEQKTLGFDDSSGLRKNLQVAGNAVERIINQNMSGAEAWKLKSANSQQRPSSLVGLQGLQSGPR